MKEVHSWENFKNVQLPTNNSDYWYQALIRDHCDMSWPEFGGKRLKRWCSQQDDCVIGFVTDMEYRNAVIYLPVFAAAVATGRAGYADVFNDSVEAMFFMRQVRDFDTAWFNSIYQYCILRDALNRQKEFEIHG